MANATRFMKRFYKLAATEPAAEASGLFVILLDGRPVKTPARNALLVPCKALADAIVEEWDGQGENIDPKSMPLTGLANAAIDRVAPNPEAFTRSLALYGQSDLLCYRSQGPQPLVERQQALWDPILRWARQRFDVEFQLVRGIMHRPQPELTTRRLAAAVEARGAFELAGLAPIVTIAGSLLIALALVEGEIGLEQAWSAATLDEAWQSEQWGEDSLATAALEARRREFDAGWRFLGLLEATDPRHVPG